MLELTSLPASSPAASLIYRSAPTKFPSTRTSSSYVRTPPSLTKRSMAALLKLRPSTSHFQMKIPPSSLSSYRGLTLVNLRVRDYGVKTAFWTDLVNIASSTLVKETGWMELCKLWIVGDKYQVCPRTPARFNCFGPSYDPRRPIQLQTLTPTPDPCPPKPHNHPSRPQIRQQPRRQRKRQHPPHGNNPRLRKHPRHISPPPHHHRNGRLGHGSRNA